jgi:hypothetical protein
LQELGQSLQQQTMLLADSFSRMKNSFESSQQNSFALDKPVIYA